MSSLEDILKKWAEPASNSEEEKCENAIKMIRKAIDKSEALSKHNIQLIPKGSYHNNTNVRLTSDVDIAVKLTDVFFAQYPDGKINKDFNNSPANYTYSQYRNDVDQAIVDLFGAENVEFGDKSIDISSNSYRVDADVVPCFEHRRYSDDGSYIKGTEFIGRYSGERVKNFPEQHYANGVNKNLNTSKRYKKVVRILKRLKYKMIDEGYKFDTISSFLIECLVWNVPNSYFNNPTLTEDVEKCLKYLIEQTSDYDKCSEWGEVSELLYLFRTFRKFTRTEANAFLEKSYEYLFK
ncbi:nucleotidyltransferase [Lysinibacillus pakistanensis]|uniref:nucleotidyltransferase domain-containing protein n=1 Tax=Lysinibacillus pakistanensis TaxID=759811 RepID=UPI003D2C0524